MDWILWGIVGIIALIAIVIVVMYNGLIVLRNRIENAMSQIDVQTKKRYDLIPNLVKTVKGYAKHERKVFMEVTKARTDLMKAKNVKEQVQANDMLTGALKTLFAVAENYPALRASENFMHLQEELSGVESKIAYSRQFYNDSVLSFNARMQTFPTSVIAKTFGFTKKKYLEIEAAARRPVKVSFE